jgi:hypothetical protein
VLTELPDPRQGAADPTEGTPARRPGSIRRTSTIDSARPEGMAGPVRQVGRARDLVTADDGSGTVVAEAEMHLVVDFAAGMLVRRITMDPPTDGLDAFLDARAGGGFRKILDLQTPVARGSLPYLLLDDVPGATLVSGYAMTMAAEQGDADLSEYRARLREAPLLQQADICAGWQSGGTLLANLSDGGPPATLGPVARSVLEHDDPDAWHPLDPLLPATMRRARRIDVWRDDDLIRVDVFFRDSMMGRTGVETAVHEYAVDVVVDAATMTVVSCVASPRVLPWRECPEAIGSAGRLVGRSVRALRPELRTELVGTSTCTHLNDVLRGLEDVDWLSQTLNRRR